MILHGVFHEVSCVVFSILQIVLYQYLVVAASNNNCEGRPHGCCEGYTFNATLETCVECAVGYFGSTCSSPCPYPTYGRDCQNMCNCTKDMCDTVKGCLKDIEILETGTAVISKKIAQKRCGGRDKPMLDIMEMGQREKPDKSNNL